MSGTLAWILLFVAGLFEVAWAIGLKYTEGFSKPVPTALTVAASARACATAWSRCCADAAPDCASTE